MSSGNEIYNCEFCGRDTKNKSRACSKCMEGISKHSPPKEIIGREDEDWTRDREIRLEVKRAIRNMIE